MGEQAVPPTVPFGTWLRRAREAKSLGLVELANLCGIVPSSMSMFEQGKRIPHFQHCIALADELHLDRNETVARMMKEQLMRSPEGKIFLAEARAGRFYDCEEYEV